MNVDEIKLRVNNELGDMKGFANFHGLTIKNIRDFVVEPYAVTVNPDDLETAHRKMWIAFTISTELFIAFDPLFKVWSVVETTSKNEYVQVVYGETLSEALDGM